MYFLAEVFEQFKFEYCYNNEMEADPVPPVSHRSQNRSNSAAGRSAELYECRSAYALYSNKANIRHRASGKEAYIL